MYKMKRRIPNPYVVLSLTSVQHAGQSRLLSRSDGEVVVALDLDPTLGVGAVEARQRGLPLVGGVAALGLVDVVGDGPELRTADVVGKGLTLGSGPFGSTRLKLENVSVIYSVLLYL